MCFAEAGAAIDKKRVVGCAGTIGDGLSGGAGELIRRSDDETVEGERRGQRPGGNDRFLGFGVFRFGLGFVMGGEEDLKISAIATAGDGYDVVEQVVADPIQDNWILSGQYHLVRGLGLRLER